MNKTNVWRAVAVWCVLSAVLCLSGPASADRVWVATQVFDPHGDVARSSLNVVVPEFGAIVPESVPLPNDEITSVTYTADGELFVAVSTDLLAEMPVPIVTVAGTHPPKPASQFDLPLALWQSTGNLLLAEADLGAFPEQVVVVPRTLMEDMTSEVSGDLLLLPLHGDQVGPTFPGEVPVTIPLPQGVAGVAPLDRDQYNAVAVVEWSGSQLWVVEVNLDAETIVNFPVRLNSANVEQTPVSIQKLPGRNEYIVVNTALDAVSSEPLTEVWLVSLVDAGPASLLNPAGQPFVLTGLPDVPAGLHGAAEISYDGSTALVATRDETTETGHIGLIDISNVRMDSEFDVPDVRENFIVRLLPGSPRILIGADHTFEMRSFAAGASVVEHELVMLQTVQDIAISSDKVTAYIAAGSEVYLYDTVAAQLGFSALSMETGVATALGVLPPVAAAADTDSDGLSDMDEISLYFTDSIDPDTDSDGISDGLDFSLFLPSPALSLSTHNVTLTAIEGRADPSPCSVRITNRGVGELLWTAYVTDVDWLDVEPSASVAPDAVIISVDATGLPASDLPYTGHVLVTGSGTVNDSPQIIDVNLFVEEVPLREAIFVAEDTGEQVALSAMNGLTGEGYALFANILLDEEYSHAFDEYAMFVLLDASSVGIVQPVIVTGLPWQLGQPSGAALLEYIDAGGTALVILESTMAEADANSINSWLAATHIQIVPGVTYSGTVEPLTGHPITAGVSEIEINRSAALDVADDTAVVLAWLDVQEGYAAIAASFYGDGRIVVMADDYAFTNARIGYADHRQLADNIFGWLSPGGATDLDTDGDGLIDRLEDANENGVVDPGETDPLNSDSDGDLVPDGREDLNVNGVVDSGETDPTNPDTDGDGLTDGADRFPLAWPKPFLSGIAPQDGSTAGGDPITIIGNYLPVDVTVMFGDVQSTSVTFVDSEHIIAESPPWSGSGDTTVDVKVIDNETEVSVTIPDAFTYVLFPRVMLSIDVGVTEKDNGTYDPVSVPITIANLDLAQPSTVDMTIEFDTLRLTFIRATLRPDLDAIGKTVQAEVDDVTQTLNLGVFSADPSPGSAETVIPSDSTEPDEPKFLTLEFEVASFVNRGTRLPLTVADALATDLAGPLPAPIETLWNDGAIVTMIDADINDDHRVNAIDLQLVINGVLGLPGVPPKADVDEDGLINVVDVQKMINVLLGFEVT